MNTTSAAPRLLVALSTYLGWVLLTLFGMRWASDGTKKPLLELVSHGISWNITMAIGLLTLVTLAMRWRDLKFEAPKPPGSLRILWFPALYLLLFAVLSAVLGLPPRDTTLFVLLNTLQVGLSEEWMFRGVLFQGLRTRLALWPAILLTSLLFGSVHVLNVMITGELLEAVVQAIAAFLSGMVMIALLIRTGSIWVPIAYHALWDFGAFMASAGGNRTEQAAAFSLGWTAALPVLLVLPNFLYALYLLRKQPNEPRLAVA